MRKFVTKHKMIILILIPIFILSFGIYKAFFDFSLDRLDGKGEVEEESVSPNGDYLAQSFIILEGGATVGAQVRVGITSLNDDGFDDTTVYWEYHENDTKVTWIDNETIEINNQVINIHEPETYYNWKAH